MPRPSLPSAWPGLTPTLADTLALMVKRRQLTETERRWLLNLAEHEKQLEISRVLESHVSPQVEEVGR